MTEQIKDKVLQLYFNEKFSYSEIIAYFKNKYSYAQIKNIIDKRNKKTQKLVY